MIESENIFNTQYIILYCSSLLFFLLFFIEDNFKKKYKLDQLRLVYVYFFSFLFLLIFGLRSFDVGIDNTVYLYFFSNKSIVQNDFGFDILTRFLRLVTNDRGYLFTIASIYMITFLLFITNWSIHKKVIVYLFFMYVSLFFFKNMGMNVIRQGIANMIFLLAIMFFEKNKKILAIALFALAFSFQATVIIPIFVWFTVKFINFRTSIYILVICSLLSILGIGLEKVTSVIPIFNKLFENRFDSYLNNSNTNYITGFRGSFFVFNWFFVLAGLYIKKNIYNSVLQEKILKSFIVLSGVFFLYFNIPYSDRIGLFSWIFIPLLFVPLFQNKKVSFELKSGTVFIFIFMFIYFVLFPSK